MKALFVESSNHYLAKGANDTMTWTPILDKQIFKLLTTISGVCVCSKHTYGLLPQKMLADQARKFIVADKTGNKSLPVLNLLYPNAYLIGGPVFLREAYKSCVIDTVIVSTTNEPIESTERYKNPLLDYLKHPTSIVKYDGLIVRVYKINNANQR